MKETITWFYPKKETYKNKKFVTCTLYLSEPYSTGICYLGDGTGFDLFGEVRWYGLCLLYGGLACFVGLLVWNECCAVA